MADDGDLSPLGERILVAAQRALESGRELEFGRFGILDAYTAEIAMTVVHAGGAIDPLAAACLDAPAVPRKKNAKARKSDRLEPVVATVLGCDVEYVAGFAQGVDGHPKWKDHEYPPEWEGGFRDGRIVRERLTLGEPL